VAPEAPEGASSTTGDVLWFGGRIGGDLSGPRCYQCGAPWPEPPTPCAICDELSRDPAAERLAAIAMTAESVIVRQLALTALHEGESDAGPALIAALRDRSWLVRGMAAQFLGATPDSHSNEALIEATRDEDAWVAYVAALTLARLPETTVRPALRRALQDDPRPITAAAAEALEAVCGEDDALLEILAKRRSLPGAEAEMWTTPVTDWRGDLVP
jgi:HEAT repeat protein